LQRPRTLPPTASILAILRQSWSSTTNCSWRMEDLCWVYNHAAAHRTARVCRDDLTVDGLHIAPEVTSCPLLPHSRDKRYLTAENIQYEEIPHELTMSSTRTAEACHVSGDRLAKGIVLRRDGDYMLVVMPASHHLRLSELRTKLGDNVDMANEAEINRLFREIYMEAGDHQTLLHLSQAQFARLTANALHGRFSAHD
jgi:Ala-tRNA(Pro) deacylase